MIKPSTFILPIIFILFAFAVLPAGAQRGIFPVAVKDRSGNQVLLYKESHALLVGVSSYTAGWPNLPGVRKDINEVKETLEQKGFHTVVVINPTRVELRDSIENFINLYGQDVDNRLIFYFAGHGHTMKSSYGEEMGYFVPADAPNPNIDKSGFLAKSINMESIEVYSKKVQSKHALFLFDSCFSGSIFALSRAIPDNISFKTSKPVRQFITAGSANETVPDESIFNDQLIRALNGEGDLDGDGYLTGVELGEFLNKTVINYSKGSQHPQYGKIRNPNLDKGDFVFSLLDRRHIEQSIDSIVQEREELEQKRLNLEEERKRIAALQRMQEEKKKLEDEKRRLKEEQEKLARLSSPFEEGQSKGIKKVKITTKTTPLRVLKDPSSKAEVIAQLPTATIVPMFQETGQWYQVEYLPGKKGWISKKYSRLVGLDSRDKENRRNLLKDLEKLATLNSKKQVSINNEHDKGKDPGEEVEGGEDNAYDSVLEKFESLAVESQKVKVKTFDAKFQSELRTLPDWPKLRDSKEHVQSLYARLVQEKIYKNWRDPLAGPHREETIISFHIYPKGNIDKPFIKQSSGVEILDTLAVRAVLDSAPFPNFPKELKKSNLFLSINFKYVPKNDESKNEK